MYVRMDLFTVSVALGFILPVLLLWPLERLFPARRGQPTWRADSWIDVAYWIAAPLLRAALMGLVLLPALAVGVDPNGWFGSGLGPLSRQPVWLQLIEMMLIYDLFSYAIHRWFHGERLWKFHAVHHSSKHLDWLSTVRHHPVNDIAMRVGQALPVLLLGFSPVAMAWCLPFLTFHSLLIHSNLNWSFGPLNYVLVSPAFHHWHHTSDPEGRDKNFTGLLPLWDVLFGTYYLPDRPCELGITRGRWPIRFGGHRRLWG